MTSPPGSVFGEFMPRSPASHVGARLIAKSGLG